MTDSTSAPEAPYLAVSGVTKQFGNFTALRDVSFSAARGAFISVLGPSGCGKTTLLRVIAGLELEDGGQVRIEDRDVSGFPVSRRNVGIVFQSYALFPNLTAAANVAYGLRGRGRSRAEIDARVRELLELVGLPDAGRQFPAQLSGGQQQRVALARAIAPSPDLLLLDEPLSALDARVRIRLRGEIRALQQRLGLTTVMVTHDQEEALTMADRILVMDGGELIQDGTPHEVYDQPATPFVANFIGAMNFIGDAVRREPGLYQIGDRVIRVRGENGTAAEPPGDKATLAIRPEDVALRPAGESDENLLSGRVEETEYRGPFFRVAIRLNAGGNGTRPLIASDLPAEAFRRLEIRPEMDLHLHLPSDRLRVYRN
jgi:iron(III) transport system ATP-binding protein